MNDTLSLSWAKALPTYEFYLVCGGGSINSEGKMVPVLNLETRHNTVKEKW